MWRFHLQRSALVLVLSIAGGCPPPPPPRHTPDPSRAASLPNEPATLVELADRLLDVKPQSLAPLDRARAALLRALPQHRAPFDVHWRLARVCAVMAGSLRNKEQRVEVVKEGMRHAELAARLAPGRVEPPYYYALNLARQAEAERSLKLIKQAAAYGERARRIDARFDRAGPLLFLGKVYLTAPAWPVSVGDVEKAIALLEQAVRLAPRPMSHLFLGQAYAADDQLAKARAHLEQALKGELEPRWRREAEKALERVRPR